MVRCWLVALALALPVGWGCAEERTPGPGQGDPGSAGDGGGEVERPSAPVAVAPAAVSSAGYRLPPREVVDIVDAPPTPAVWVSPAGDTLLLGDYDALPSVVAIAHAFEGLAGVRVDPTRRAERRTRLYDRLVAVDVATGTSRPIMLPADTALTSASWSPDGKRVAFGRWLADGVELWVADVAAGTARRVIDRRLCDVIAPGYAWMPGSQQLLAWLVPADAKEQPPRASVPIGPSVDDTAGRKATNRTYQDLLRGPEDEERFEFFATSELVVVSAGDGAIESLGEPDLYMGADASPDGKYVLVDRIRKPFSYAVPYYRFSRVTEVRERSGKVVRVVLDEDVADEVPIGGVRTGPRSVVWHDQKPATLLWYEALDDGDPKKEVDHRDRVLVHPAPFADVPKEVFRTQHRLQDVSWTSIDGKALVREYDRDRRWTTTWLYDLHGGTEPRKLIDRSVHDAYGDPGRPVSELRPDGTVVVPVHDGAIFLDGRGASPEGQRPFLDRMRLHDGATERVFESEAGTHSEFVDFVLGDDHARFLIRRETQTEVPNYHLVESGKTRPVTRFEDPHPQLTGIETQILSYTRRDGVKLSGTLYLPPGYQKGDRLPLVVWAYPVEYNDPDTAGQVRAAPNRFTRLAGTSPLMFLTQGYAVLNGAAMPIVGDPETMNDTFVEQAVASAQAAIDAVVGLGVADPERVGIGGHSYGAFMTANLLAHSDLFRAGIARSGAYNRTLTPFGFQSERRTLWEAPDTYVAVSPLFAADKINEPLLLVHGEADANAGTYPLQSERMYRALEGNEGTARLVLLPHESHGYAARESVLHVLAESFEWFDKHVERPG